jgi:hypothetical protein
LPNSCKLNAQSNYNINTNLKQKSKNISGMHRGLPCSGKMLVKLST